MRASDSHGRPPRSALLFVRAAAASLFLFIALSEAYDAHRWRFWVSWISIARGEPVRARPLERDCLSAHPLEPGICALSAAQRAAVLWVRAGFPKDALPIVYADDTVSRIRMRYYARTPWMRRRESHCVLYYSEKPEVLSEWRARPRSVMAMENAVLSLPGSETAGGQSSLDLSRAVAACRDLPRRVRVAPAAFGDVVDLCRATPARWDSRIEVLGLGGIEVGVVSRDRGEGPVPSLAARAFFVSAGTSIEAVALFLKGPDGSQDAHHDRPRAAAFSYDLTHDFLLPEGRRPGVWAVTACMIDSEGFATAAATHVRLH